MKDVHRECAEWLCEELGEGFRFAEDDDRLIDYLSSAVLHSNAEILRFSTPSRQRRARWGPRFAHDDGG